MRGLVVSLLLVCATAHGQEYADAEGEMARAAEYYRTGNYKAALVHYQAAQKLAPDKPGPYLWLGLTHATLGECAEAIPFLEQYLLLKKTDVKAEAMRTLAECRAKTANSAGRLVVTSTPPGAEVRVDVESGDPAGTTPYENAALAPGPHSVFVTKGGFRPARQEAKIAPGMISNLSFTLEAIVAPPPPRPVEAPKAKPRYWIAGVVVGSVAAVALGVGLGVGLGLPKGTVLEPIGP
jgi:tetratricopeptide (TPR) repeat protein